jgi:Lon protease-like protein
MRDPAPDDMMQTPPQGTASVPEVIPIFPLPNVVLLPGEVLPLHVFEPRYTDLVRDAIASHRVIGMVEYQPDHSEVEGALPPVREVGCVGFIAQHEQLPDGRYMLWLIGLERFRIVDELDLDTRYRQVRVHYDPVRESPKRLAGIRALREELRSLLPGLLALDDASREQFAVHMAEVSDTQLIALACQILELPSDRKQEVLEADSLSDRFLMVYEDLYRHLDVNPDFEAIVPEDLN